jgi:hypothetical protein
MPFGSWSTTNDFVFLADETMEYVKTQRAPLHDQFVLRKFIDLIEIRRFAMLQEFLSICGRSLEESQIHSEILGFRHFPTR